MAARNPHRCSCAKDELDDAIRQLPLSLVAGLQVAIKNVAFVANGGVNEDIDVELSRGSESSCAKVPVGSAAVYVPGGRAPYASTVVMGIVTARAAGVLDVSVCAPAGPRRPDRSRDPRHLPPLRRRTGVSDGRSAGDRRARLRDGNRCAG